MCQSGHSPCSGKGGVRQWTAGRSRYKDWENAAEEARVRAAQLDAYAYMLEAEAAVGGEGEAVAALARALLAPRAEWNAAWRCVRIEWGDAAVEEVLRLRDGVHPARCVVSGRGHLNFSHVNPSANRVIVSCVNAEGWESIMSGDVSASVEGGTVTELKLGERGCVELAYAVEKGRGEPISLRVNVCGAALPGSPWCVCAPLRLSDSAALHAVPAEAQRSFLCSVPNWLPQQEFELLYRGSRDGMTARAFHRLCDDAGPTLVLIQSRAGRVFGGYAAESWCSPPGGCAVPSKHCFLFTVGEDNESERIPLSDGLWCRPGGGPNFYRVLTLGSELLQEDAVFDSRGSCWKLVRQGVDGDSVTGSPKGRFFPVEVEVYSVRPGDG